jgi:hypothetical protein
MYVDFIKDEMNPLCTQNTFPIKLWALIKLYENTELSRA